MLVGTERGQWVVPPTRAIWLPIGTWHQVSMVSKVRMRSIYVRGDRLKGCPPIAACWRCRRCCAS